MDAVIFIGICLVLVYKQLMSTDSNDTVIEEIEAEDVTRVAKLNDAMFEDPDAFMDYARMLGCDMGDRK